jgi:hypothetical protein
MTWKLKSNVFGIDLDLDIETRLPLQEIYDLRLKLNWGIHKNKSSDQSKDFMYYALCHLPEGSFINLSFDEEGEYFIQFANIGGNILLDIPILPTNYYYGHERKIIKLLKSMHLERVSNKNKDSLSAVNKFWITRDYQKVKTIQASFGEFHIWAGVTAVVIIEEIFKIKEPLLSHFASARLVPVAT